LEIARERLFVEVGGGRVGRLVFGEFEIKVGCGGKKKNSWKDGGSGGGSGSRREVASRTPSDQTTIGLVEIVALGLSPPSQFTSCGRWSIVGRERWNES
jgi:hypothetical protein